MQRGDAEMSQKLWRVVRACVDMGPDNPIEQIHDQGAGGNCNVVRLLWCWEVAHLTYRMQGVAKLLCLTLHKQLVLFVQVKEIIYPLGAEIDVREIKLGDETMSVLEIWGAEYQENDALLIKPEARPVLEAICRRERCLLQARPCSCPAPTCTAAIHIVAVYRGEQALLSRPSDRLYLWPATGSLPRLMLYAYLQVIGSISGSGKIMLKDRNAPPDVQPAVDLDLEKVLGKMPRKTFEFTRIKESLAPLDLSAAGSVSQALSRVLRLPAVGSKRFLTTKVDRCVTGAGLDLLGFAPCQYPEQQLHALRCAAVLCT